MYTYNIAIACMFVCVLLKCNTYTRYRKGVHKYMLYIRIRHQVSAYKYRGLLSQYRSKTTRSKRPSTISNNHICSV